MPNRWIRERCRSSQSLANLSDKAERLFWRLTTVADDYGCFEAEPEIVQSECFKRTTNRPSLTDVNKCLQMLADENIINFYNHNNKLYGVFVNWRESQGKPRAEHPKYPLPTDVRRCLQVQTDAPVFVSESVSESENRENLSSIAIGAPHLERPWETYVITDRMREWVKENGLGNPDDHLDAFKDHFRKTGGKTRGGVAIKDWDAAFRTWMRNTKTFGAAKTVGVER